MGKHPTYIPGYYGTIKELAEAVENLPYDEQAKFMKHYINAHKRRVKGDEKDRKLKLVKGLHNFINNQNKGKEILDRIWKICKPYTTKINRN